MEGTLEDFSGAWPCPPALLVSIHLFMEGTLEEVIAHQTGGRYAGFQSIYSWKVLWKKRICNEYTGFELVSIHLFMEGTLEAD